MKLTVNEEQTGAWLSEGNETFGLIGEEISSPQGEYACYYKDVKSGILPFALTREGVQVPIEYEDGSKGASFVTYDELVTLVKAGKKMAEVFE